MEPMGNIRASKLGRKDLPWRLAWSKEKCTLCGKCTAVCPLQALELGVHRKRLLDIAVGITTPPSNIYGVYHGICQRTDIEHLCVGCGMCELVCPNQAIGVFRNDEIDKARFHRNQGGVPRRRGGRRNNSASLLDAIKFIRISMLTDPALDAGRHEFEIRTLLGRVLPAEDIIRVKKENGVTFRLYARFIPSSSARCPLALFLPTCGRGYRWGLPISMKS
jgi:glutamate synthase (NADPH/NADH) large chain